MVFWKNATFRPIHFFFARIFGTADDENFLRNRSGKKNRTSMQVPPLLHPSLPQLRHRTGSKEGFFFSKGFPPMAIPKSGLAASAAFIDDHPPPPPRRSDQLFDETDGRRCVRACAPSNAHIVR